MSLETEHRRHHTEPTPHPDEPQPIKWTGRRTEVWTEDRIGSDLDGLSPVIPPPIGQHRKPWGRRAAPWTAATANTDKAARTPEWSMA